MKKGLYQPIKPFLKQTGAWYEVEIDGKPKKFQQSHWEELMKEETFQKTIYNLMDEEVIVKFDKREGDSKNYYNIEGDESAEQVA